MHVSVTRAAARHYGEAQALRDVNVDIYENEITALIGPSGCGKSIFLRALNRMNDLIPSARTVGSVCLDGTDIYAPDVVLMDEPASALDPISTFKIEELMVELKERYTVVLVTHNMYQASRVSQRSDPKLVKQSAHFMLISRYLERIADHVTNVAERIVYMETGELEQIAAAHKGP